jgi:hypothetical protein
MAWVFAAVVLALAVYNEGFRMMVFWCAGVAAIVITAALIFIK